MKITKKVRKTQIVTTDILCNKCGNSLKEKLTTDGKWSEFYGLIECQVSGGYCSPVLSDCIIYSFSLCERCLQELFENFKISVDAKHYAP
jgi:hypothetical protein